VPLRLLSLRCLGTPSPLPPLLLSLLLLLLPRLLSLSPLSSSLLRLSLPLPFLLSLSSPRHALVSLLYAIAPRVGGGAETLVPATWRRRGEARGGMMREVYGEGWEGAREGGSGEELEGSEE
jgi:hypothetical protein